MLRTDRIERQERRAAAVTLFQKLNGGSAVALGIDNDMLHGSAERRLHGERIAVIGLDEICDRAMNAAQSAALRLAHDRLDGLGIALISALQILEHLQTGLGGAQINRHAGELRLGFTQRVVCLLRGLCAFAAALSILLYILTGARQSGGLLFKLLLQGSALLSCVRGSGLQRGFAVKERLALIRQHRDRGPAFRQ